MAQAETIFALSSGAPPSGVAVVRLSGERSKPAVEALCGLLPADRRATLLDIHDAKGELIDRGIVIVFSSPRSFTGEDCAELQVHGGRASVAALLSALGSMEGLRQAEAGEFTRRAFVNGKMDLTGVEALGDLISAETEMQRRFALANAGGRQFATYRDWRERIVHARAMIEAELDFSDEDDVPGSVASAVWQDIAALAQEMRGHIEGANKGEILREGFRVVILGAPNAGKSSLLNRLADRDVAIVSDEAGTTRDLVEVVLDLDGVRTVVTDTAGLRDMPGRVEAIGIERALERAADADLIIALEDLTDRISVMAPDGVEVLRVGSKVDLVDSTVLDGGLDLVISSASGQGVEDLVARIRDLARERVQDWESTALPSRLRHVDLVQLASTRLHDAIDEAASLELRAESLRLAGDEIGAIVGAIGSEEVLGAIFSNFCIGK